MAVPVVSWLAYEGIIMVFLLVVDGAGHTGGGPTALQLRGGVGPAMKPEMGMWLTTAAGNNGLFHRSTFFPLHFVSKYCVF